MLMLAYGHGPQCAERVLGAWATDLGTSPRTVAERMVEGTGTTLDTSATPPVHGVAGPRRARSTDARDLDRA